jgi:beta-glucosidase-like glycosyl hydrolase
MDFHQFLIPRLEGNEIESNLPHYLELVKKGVAGFIVFGGELETLRKNIGRLQEEASSPLIISSDLEQGLGQQVKGGTVFPPAMAVAQAEKESPGLARQAFECMAREASYAGINTIFAPVLDVNTNPENPIISARAFSDEPKTVSALGTTMVEAFMENGIKPCGKHFPGHGSTSVDSHLALPKVDRTLDELEACELKPFRAAIAAGVPMLMLGHLNVPALDVSETPISLSAKAIGYLREIMGFSGIVITDAMDMGGLGSYTSEEASLMALAAGVDLLLHPGDPGGLADELGRSDRSFSTQRVSEFRRSLQAVSTSGPPAQLCEDLSGEITRKAIRVEGHLTPIKNPFVLLLSDDEIEGSLFVDSLRVRFPSLDYKCLVGPTIGMKELVPNGTDLIVAVYSKVKAFKGGPAPWIKEALMALDGRAGAVVSFGSPYILDTIGSNTFKIFAWWDKQAAQLAAVNILLI